MTRLRAVGIAAAIAVAGAGACGRGAGAKADGGAGAGGAGTAGAAIDAGGAGAAGGAGGAPDAGRDAAKDLASDFGGPTPEVAAHCPLAAGALPPAGADVLIDDFDATGPLDGRTRAAAPFTVKEQFEATPDAHFDPAPAIDPACGAAAPGSAHIRGTAAGPGATFAVIFSSGGDGGKPADHDDASGTRGITFRAALGDAKASALFTLQVNAAGSQWDYTKDVVVTGTTWQDVQILWSDLEAAPGAPAFTPATLNQLVFPFAPDAAIDLYVDDLAFLK
jgi:hypothetical protein